MGVEAVMVKAGRRRMGRRGLLTAAAAAGAAALVRGGRARAGAGEPLIVGEINVAARETVLAAGRIESAVFRAAAGAGIALYGQSGDAFALGSLEAGLCGTSSRGAAVYAAATEQARALEVRGRVAFSSAGVSHVPGNMASWTVEGVSVPGGSLILAELQNYGGPKVGVRYVARVSEDRFRVTFTAMTTRPCRLAYFILEPAA